MTKKELIEALEPYDDDIEIYSNGDCMLLIDLKEGCVTINNDGATQSLYLCFEE